MGPVSYTHLDVYKRQQSMYNTYGVYKIYIIYSTIYICVCVCNVKKCYVNNNNNNSQPWCGSRRKYECFGQDKGPKY